MELADLKGEGSYVPLRESKGKSPGRCSLIFFWWVWGLLIRAQSELIQLSHLIRIPSVVKTKNQTLDVLLKSHSLIKSLFFSQQKYIYLSLFLNTIVSFLAFTGPLYIQLLSAYLTSSEKSLSYGLTLLFSFILVNALAIMIETNSDFLQGVIENRVRNSLCSCIYNKTLRIQTFPDGMGVNLMQVDAKKIYECISFLGEVITIPIELTLAVYFMYTEIGNAMFAGIGCFFVVIVINAVLGVKMKKYNEEVMKLKDKRMDISKQAFGEIRAIKTYVWESYFKRKIMEVRDQELGALKKYFLLGCFNIFSLWMSVPMTIVTMFIFYTQVMGESLSPEKAFVTVSAMVLVQEPLRTLPFAITHFVQALVSAKRIQTLFDTEELKTLEFGDAIQFENATKEPMLKDINLNIEPGSFVAIIGPVGSGKSSILNAIMGEINVEEGTVTTVKELSYAPSLDSWLMNDTLRNNILMGSEYKENWYWQVINACGLFADLEVLPGRDLAEIGEKGINLSGGQKARVNLARAVYANKDTILLDDPLSSVDTHMAKHIFKNCLCGLLAGKTRLLVTHRLEFLDKVDKVIIMEEGRIKEITTPDTLTLSKEDSEAKEEEKLESKEVQNIIEDEDREMGRVSSSVYLSYFKSSGGYFFMIIVCVVMILWTLATVLGDIVLKEWSESSESSDGNFLMLVYTFLRIGGSFFILFRCLLVLNVIGIKVSRKTHKEMIKSLFRAPINYFYDVTPTGRIFNRLSKDQNEVDDELSWLIGSYTAIIGSILGLLCVQFVYFPHLIIIAPVIFYSAIKISAMYLGAARELRRLESLSKSKILNIFGECISGMKFIRAFRKTNFFIKKNEILLDENTKISYNLIGSRCWLTMTLSMVSTVFVIVIFVLIIMFRDSISPGAVGLCISYSIVVPEVIVWCVFLATEIEKNMISVERILSYVNLKPEEPNKMKTDPNNWPQVPSILYRNVFLKYRESTPYILKDLSFNIEPGTRVGIVGRTGSGKSSIFVSMLRIVEATRGVIFVDGMNIAKLGLKLLRSKVTLIPQDPVVFEDTLRNNLDPAHLQSEEDVKQALRAIQLQNFEIDHQIKGKGSNLSVGERQLISIGRAILGHSKILLLDEATAGIDTETDKQIQKLIREKFGGCTLLVIAHRLETIMDSDEILVMDSGRVVECGKPSELMESESFFKQLVKNMH